MVPDLDVLDLLSDATGRQETIAIVLERRAVGTQSRDDRLTLALGHLARRVKRDLERVYMEIAS